MWCQCLRCLTLAKNKNSLRVHYYQKHKDFLADLQKIYNRGETVNEKTTTKNENGALADERTEDIKPAVKSIDKNAGVIQPPTAQEPPSSSLTPAPIELGVGREYEPPPILITPPSIIAPPVSEEKKIEIDYECAEGISEAITLLPADIMNSLQQEVDFTPPIERSKRTVKMGAKVFQVLIPEKYILWALVLAYIGNMAGLYAPKFAELQRKKKEKEKK